MIVPLKRVALFCLQSAKEETLARLAELGLFHVVTNADAPESAPRTVAREDAGAVARGIAAVQAAAALKPVDFLTLSLRAGTARIRKDAPEVVQRANLLADLCAEASEEIDALEQTLGRYGNFGAFDPAQARALAASGIPVTLFTALPSAEMPAMETGFLEVLALTDDCVYGVAVGGELPEGLTRIPLPAESVEQTRAKLEKARAKKLTAVRDLRAMVADLPALRDAATAADEADAYALALEAMASAGPVCHIGGYLDARKEDTLLAEARKQGWGVALRDPEPEENPPTLLETPRPFRPVFALFRGLGILPAYSESDVSVPFFLFFTIFFAMLIGDAGYAAILLGITVFAHFKLKKKAGAEGLPEFARSALTLLYVFSSATLVYGLLSGTIFGMPSEWLPEAYAKSATVTWLGDMNNVMRMCFIIGTVHLTIARLWNAVDLFPDTKFIAELGWTGVVWSMYFIISSLVLAGAEQPSFTVPLMVVSILLIVLFMLHKDELKTDGISLGMLPLNIISSMGDIISYLRLYAVGLASVKVAQNFDTMAAGLGMPLLLKIPVMVLILLAGHAINFAMGGLSILVHAVRLNTLEFSGAKGVTWSGHEFKPFRARAPRISSARQQA